MMTNEECVEQLKMVKLFTGYDKDNEITIRLHEALDMAIKALESKCDETYMTCTECPHYDHEKHYCPKFCSVIRDTLDETKSSIDVDAIIAKIEDMREKDALCKYPYGRCIEVIKGVME